MLFDAFGRFLTLSDTFDVVKTEMRPKYFVFYSKSIH